VIGIVLICFARSRKKLTGAVIYGGTLVLLNIRYFVWKFQFQQLDEDYLSRLRPSIVATNVGRLPDILTACWNEVSNFSHWGIFGMLPIPVANPGWRAWRQPEVNMLWLLMIGHVLIYVVIYMVSPHDLHGIFHVTVDHLSLHITPAVMLLTALHWSATHSAKSDCTDHRNTDCNPPVF
jgi:hypothetical protein